MIRRKLGRIIIAMVLLASITGCVGTKTLDSVKYDDNIVALDSYIEQSKDNLGAIFPNMYSAGEQYAIFASYFGMYVIDVQKAQVIDYVDLAKYGCNQFQGDQIVQIITDADDIYFYNMENGSISGKIYKVAISDGTLEELAQDEYENVQATETSVISYDSFVTDQEGKLADALSDYTDTAKSDVLDMGKYKLFTVAKDWKLSNLKIVLVDTETGDVKEIDVK